MQNKGVGVAYLHDAKLVCVCAHVWACVHVCTRLCMCVCVCLCNACVYSFAFVCTYLRGSDM